MAKEKGKKSEKKSHSTDRAFSYFNKKPPPETLGELMNSLHNLCYIILEEHNTNVELWCTIDGCKKLVNDLWDNKDAVYFKRCHLDRLVDEFGYMLWNGVEDKIRKEWLRSGHLPKMDEISKKLKKNGEYVSSFIADRELERFKDNFR